MVYVPQPYVTTGNNNSQQQNNQYSPTRQPQNNSYATTGSGGTYAPASAGGYGGGGGGTNASNAYASSRPAATSTTSTSNRYGSSPYAGSTSNHNNSYGASSAPRTNTPTSTALPDFSQALNNPPPTAPAASTSYGSSTPTNNNYASTSTYGSSAHPKSTTDSSSFSGGGYSPAVAIPVNNTGGYSGGYNGGGGVDNKLSAGSVAVSALNSSTYTGGPTGGLISEGNPTQCHKVDYEIKGHEMQLVEIELDPSETVIAEAGAMMYMDEGIDFKTKFGDGSTPKQGFFKKLLAAGGRLLMGESLFITHFSNQGQAKARVAFAAPFPGTILPINLQNLNGKLICQKDAFLCAAKGTKLSIHLNKKLGSGLFGGEGFILQKLEGDGMAFVHAGGMVIKRELRGEKLRIDTGCVMAFTDGINFDIQFVPGLKSMIFGGEGLFLATLQGTGTVWMQSLPFSRLADRVVQHAPSIGGRRQGEGSALTGKMGDMINGDGFGFKF